jgi:hypothetical protein
MCVWVWAPTFPCRNVRALSVGVDRVRFGPQAFSVPSQLSAFNANIGAWNTASVTTLSYVCADFGRRREPAAGALGRSPMRRGPLCAGGSADARACVCAHVHALACAGVRGCMYSCTKE